MIAANVLLGVNQGLTWSMTVNMKIDLVGPARGEAKLVEKFLGIAVPTREEMQEIEVSSRLYVENGARYREGLRRID